MNGAAMAVCSWLDGQAEFRPQEILPAVITRSKYRNHAEASSAAAQWVEVSRDDIESAEAIRDDDGASDYDRKWAREYVRKATSAA